MSEQRRDRRIRTRFETLYSTERREGGGMLADISYSGARFEQTSLQPRAGARVRIHVFLPSRSEPFELVGEVVRVTEQGFAIRYEKPKPEVCRLVDDAAALVSLPDS